MDKTFADFETSILNAAENKQFERLLLLAKACQAQFAHIPFGFKAEGFALMQLNRKKEAIAPFERAVELDENDAESLSNLGQTLTECAKTRDDIVRAKVFLEKALAIEPRSPVILNNLAAAMVNEKKPHNLQKAKDLALKALSINPQYDLAYNTAGICFLHLKQLHFAKEYFEKALSINPHSGLAHNGLGMVAQKEGLWMKALFHHQKAFECAPQDYKIVTNLASVLHNVGETDMASALLDAFAQVPEMEIDILQLRMMMAPYQESTTIKSMGELAQRLKEKTRALYPQKRQFTAPLSAKKRLRIGFLSGDLREHACSFFILPLLLGKKKEAPFDFIAFDTAGKKEKDATTLVLEPYFQSWHHVDHLNDKELTQLIAEQAIDILLDLSGYTEGNRLFVFSLHPAPICITWIGFAGTTGCDGITHIFCNSTLVPHAAAEQQFSEKPLYLKYSWAAYHPASNFPPVSPLPALKNKHITFGSFINPNKAQMPTLKLWAAILKQLPGAQLIWCRGNFKEKAFLDKYKNALHQLGVCPQQIRLNDEPYLEQLPKVDFILDSFPISGGTTTCEALYMGIPVLTLTGELMASRLSANYLTYAGLQDWVCQNKEEYIQKALFLAQDFVAHPEKWNDLRQNLRHQFISSPVCNATLHADDFFSTVRNAYEQWANQAASSSF